VLEFLENAPDVFVSDPVIADLNVAGIPVDHRDRSVAMQLIASGDP